MPFIEAIFKGAAFGPEMISAMSVAYDRLAAELGLARKDDPLNRRLAEAVITVARTGESDPEKLYVGVIRLLSSKP